MRRFRITGLTLLVLITVRSFTALLFTILFENKSGDTVQLAHPAVKIDGMVYGTSGTHLDCIRDYIIKRCLSPYQRRSEDRWDIAMGWLETNWEQFHREHQMEDGFIGTDGRFYNREESIAFLSKSGKANMGKEQRDWVDSTDLCGNG